MVALLSLSSWCLVVVVWLFLAVPWVCLQFVIVVFPDHTRLLFLSTKSECEYGVVSFTVKFTRVTHVDILIGEKEAVIPNMSKYL